MCLLLQKRTVIANFLLAVCVNKIPFHDNFLLSLNGVLSHIDRRKLAVTVTP